MTPAAAACFEPHPVPLRCWTSVALGYSLLERDPAFPRIPEQARHALVEAALAEGRAQADCIKRDFGRDPLAIAERLHVAVSESHEDAGFGTVVVFAEYATRPPRITLYRPAIARLTRLLDVLALRALLNARSCEQVFLAHELYHHVARIGPQPPLSGRHRVPLLRFGRWVWSRGIASLEEIAAGAFAQGLLGLGVHPRLLDLLWLRQPASWSTVRPGVEISA
ncbi:MAG TPA: hypothetical protein VMH32_08785 [Burkholderiales bacterium]|nr:hypothetical protein [Burkholderiales bacterium]